MSDVNPTSLYTLRNLIPLRNQYMLCNLPNSEEEGGKARGFLKGVPVHIHQMADLVLVDCACKSVRAKLIMCF